MSIKAVIFDKDGTVLDFDAFWLPIAVEATEVITAKLGIIDVPSAQVLEALGVKDGVASIMGSLCFGTYTDMARDMNTVLRRYGYSHSLEEMTALTVDAYHSSVGAGDIKPTCENIKEVMEELKRRDIMIILVTSDGPVVTKQCLEGLGIAEYFDRVYTDDGTHPNKPDPYLINRLCEDCGFSKAEVVMVGDTLTDMAFAENAGVRAVGLAKNEENKAILLQKTDTVIPDISYLNNII